MVYSAGAGDLVQTPRVAEPLTHLSVWELTLLPYFTSPFFSSLRVTKH